MSLDDTHKDVYEEPPEVMELKPVIAELARTRICPRDLILLVDRMTIVKVPSNRHFANAEAYRLYLTDQEWTIQAVLESHLHRMLNNSEIREGSYIFLNNFEIAIGQRLNGVGQVLYLKIFDFHLLGVERRDGSHNPQDNCFGTFQQRLEGENVALDHPHHICNRNSQWSLRKDDASSPENTNEQSIVTSDKFPYHLIDENSDEILNFPAGCDKRDAGKLAQSVRREIFSVTPDSEAIMDPTRVGPPKPSSILGPENLRGEKRIYQKPKNSMIEMQNAEHRDSAETNPTNDSVTRHNAFLPDSTSQPDPGSGLPRSSLSATCQIWAPATLEKGKRGMNVPQSDSGASSDPCLPAAKKPKIDTLHNRESRPSMGNEASASYKNPIGPSNTLSDRQASEETANRQAQSTPIKINAAPVKDTPPPILCQSSSPWAVKAIEAGASLQRIERPLKLSTLASVTGSNRSRNRVIDVLAMVESVDEFTTKPTQMPLKRNIRIMDASTEKKVVLSIFVDPVDCIPEKGDVVLFRNLVTHDFNGGNLNAYPYHCGGKEWYIPNPYCIERCHDELSETKTKILVKYKA